MEIDTKDILMALFNPENTVCFRVFDDKKRGIFKGAKLHAKAGKFSAIENTLRLHNRERRGIFFVVNYGGDYDENITRINAQFVEMDDISFEEQQKAVDSFPLPPSLIIKTRKSLHVYWFMKNAHVKKFRRVQQQLIKHFHGDPVCINESRVMRLPGFYHCKQEPVMVSCISFHPERKYTQEQLSEILPQAEENMIETKRGDEKGLEILLHQCDFIKHCRENAAVLSEHDWYAMITNLAPFEGGTALIHKLSKPYKGYSQQETQRKINHFFESGTRPITCFTIGEKGFKCPKMEAGQCTCKSPASLCYKPMSLETIRSVLTALEVTEDSLMDMQTAKTFIEKYLYNQDTVTAEAIINYELKRHFSFKSSVLRSLFQVYKDLSKNYQAGAKLKEKRANSDLPDWYRPTQQGLKFLPGVLAKEMAQKEHVFYAAQQHYVYESGVYREMSEMEAQSMIQKKMIACETKMPQIADAERQWRLYIQKDIRELNANPFIINLRNGLYNLLEDTLLPHSPNKATSKMADAVEKIVDLQEELNKDIDKLVNLKKEISAAIKAVPSVELQTLLEKRYLCFQTWEVIAVEMGYSMHHLYKLHNHALTIYGVILKGDT